MGPFLLLLSAACFGAMGVFGKLAYAAGVTPGTLLLFRFALAAALLAALVALRSRARSRRPADPPGNGLSEGSGRDRRRSALRALALGALGYATPSMLYFSALERIDASLVALVLYTYPAFVTLAAAALGRERLTLGRLAALGVASCGTLLVLLGVGGLGFDLLGVALAFGAAVTYTAYVLIGDTAVRRTPPLVLTAWVMTGAALALVARAVVAGGLQLDFGIEGWVWIGCMALVSTVAGMYAFFAGLQRTGPSTTAIVSTFEPVVTAALAALVLGELLTPVQVLGAVLVVSSVAILQLGPRTARPPASDTRAEPAPAHAAAS